MFTYKVSFHRYSTSARCVCLFAALLLAACGSEPSGTAQTSTESPTAAQSATAQISAPALQLPAGFRAAVYATGLRQPTALAFGPDGRLYITQLNGGENDGKGEVVVIDGVGAAPRTVLANLSKPTGLVWRGSDLFLAAARDVLQTSADANGTFAPPRAIVSGLSFNSRAEGQIALLPDNRLVFEASGAIGDDQSGRLFTLLPDGKPEVLATGLKNAYDHAVDPASGQLYTTDIGDDPMDGKAPPEEINAVTANGDYGWPRCYDAQVPATDRGGNAATCAATKPPVVTFPPHTTPTGLTFYANTDFPPDYRNVLYVALWNGSPPQVLRVTLRKANGATVGEAAPFISGIQAIDLLPDPRGGLLVLDHAGGVVYRITATTG